MKKGWLKRQADLARKDIKSGMKPKKPDRFERMVTWERDKYTCLSWSFVAKLLRKEHKAMVRMVEKEKRETRELINRIEPGHPATVNVLEARIAQCHDILDHLTRRAR